MTPYDKIKAAFAASGLVAFDYTEHVRAADGTMVTYSSLKRAASIRIALHGDELRASLIVMHPKSMIVSTIGDLSFPHPHINTFMNQLEKLAFYWNTNEGAA